MTFNPNHKTQRVFGAAYTLLNAMKSQAGMNSMIPIGVNAASSVRCYTLKELVDAMSMLIHMGLVPDQRNCGKSKRRGQAQRSSNDSRPGWLFVETQSPRKTIVARSATLN